MTNESRQELHESASHNFAESSDSRQLNGLEREARDTLASGSGNARTSSNSQNIESTKDLEKKGALPSLSLEDAAQFSKREPTSMSTAARTDTSGRECKYLDTSVAGGRHIPSLEVNLAGLPASESGGSLSAFPVNNKDKATEQSFATAAHGFTKLPDQTMKNNYQLLDDGFKRADSNHDGSLSKEELQSKLREQSLKLADLDSDHQAKDLSKEESLKFQAQYILDNYDKIARKSKELDPSSKGVTNEGLAQHYMESAQITVRTHDGTSFPAHLAAADRNKNITILKADGLTAAEKASVGKNFEVSGKDASVGDFVTGYGFDGGAGAADRHCHLPDQSSGLISSGKERGQLMPGEVQKARVNMASGMSGGPVVDAQSNKVIGMIHAGGYQYRENLIVPASSIKELMEKAKHKKI